MSVCRGSARSLGWLSSGIALLLACGVEEPNGVRQETQILNAPDTTLGDIYGGAVSLSGNYAFVAAEWDDDDGKDSGAVWVFERSESEWTPTQKLRAPDAEAGDNFGRSIAMDGGLAVIGTHWDDSPGHKNAGSAYVYRLDEERWALEQKLVAKDPANWAAMGNAVSIHGDWIAVAAWRRASGGDQGGVVYLFGREGKAWSQKQVLRASDAAPMDQFGRGVWIDGDALVVGAWGDDERGKDAGAAYVFRLQGERWIQEQKLTPLDAKPGDKFGFAVSLDDDVALIGSHLSSQGAPISGAAYVYRYDGERWAQEQKLVAESPLENESVGMSVAIQGDLALVSAHCSFQKVENKPGSAYLFKRTDQRWELASQFKPSDSHAGDVFGFHLALDRRTAVLGSWRHKHAGRNSGRAYVFEDL